MAKILIVDDEPLSRKLCSKAIRKIDHFTIEASDGHIAWSILMDNPDIDLVITDHQMPTMSGRELASNIHNHPELRDIPVIMMSGQISIEEVRDLLGLGITRFLDKPVPIDKLQEYVIDLLDPRLSLLARPL